MSSDSQPKRKNPKAFRLSDQGDALLESLSKHLGVKQTAVVEMAIRRMAKAEGIPIAEASDGRGGSAS